MSDLATTLSDYTLPELMVPVLRPGNTASVVAELCRAMERTGRVTDGLAFYATVMRREQACSTAAPGGWALPHARVEGLAQLSFAVGRTATEMDWLEAQGQPVHLVFLLAVPEGDTSYLRLVSGLARLNQDPVRLKGLLSAADGEAMFRALREISLPRPPSSNRLAKG
jgi:fructose PTS system EIIBC or EIIC component